MLGTRTLGDTRVKFFLTPDFDRLDAEKTVVDAAAQQSGAMKSALIIASDRLGHIGLLVRRINIISLRDIAKVEATAQFSIDDATLLSIVVPEATSARRPGRQPEQRDRILPILDELAGEGRAETSRTRPGASSLSVSSVAIPASHRLPKAPSCSRSIVGYAARDYSCRHFDNG